MPFISRLNAIRRDNPALHRLRNLHFCHADNDLVLAYAKSRAENHLLIIVSLDAWHTQDAFVEVPLERFNLAEGQSYVVEDLLTNERYTWTGRRNFVRLFPESKPGHVLRVVQ